MERYTQPTTRATKVLLLLFSMLVPVVVVCAQTPDRITYQGLSLDPGDVINFQGGIFTSGGFLTYGHTALYLGVDDQKGERSFLDFSPTKEAATSSEFYGRILPEKEFLEYNARHHTFFDVFRLRQAQLLDKRRLIGEAKVIAANKRWLLPTRFTEVCSTAVANVLSSATGLTFGIITPDGFANDENFQRHGGKTITISVALRELGVRRELKKELALYLERRDSLLESLAGKDYKGQTWEDLLAYAQQQLREQKEGVESIRSYARERKRLFQGVSSLSYYSEQLDQLDERLDLLVDKSVMRMLQEQVQVVGDGMRAAQRQDVASYESAGRRLKELIAQRSSLAKQVSEVHRRYSELIKSAIASL